ncbi:TraB/GumN family protein [Massilia sp. Mn16-1_5]|uniref:TraB/GumN family protein n=1 Tax=Massilia sp. Mn16-1_5 TaxID=2079199 RepID=UPI00109E6984|nr:TraB/GumN family protein [Massilia sp. Mn16-1_5]THC41386.1 TraB/GumN family protein [Massilia sp. Mn16-1_5]
MRRSIIVVFLSLFLMAYQALAAERGALFKVTNAQHTLYLYGTIHAGKPDYYPLEPRIGQAVAAAPTLVLEVDTASNPDAVAAAFREHGLFPAGRPGYAGLPAERRKRLEAAMKRQGIDPAGVAQLKPWVLATMLAVGDMVKLGVDPALGVDLHLASLARGKSRIVELESVQYQAALMNRLPIDIQWRLLEETLDNMASGRQLREGRELFDAYERADRKAFDAIARRVEADDSVSGKFMREVVLFERNGPMADKLAALLARENNAVAAVGLMHLLGKQGVPELLRQRGLQVERVY